MNIESQRLDTLLVQKGLASTRAKASEMIKRGFVSVNKSVIKKPSDKTPVNSEISISNSLPFVGRGGEKIEGAFKYWNIDLKNKIVLDVGSSTGGFTDASLKRGAKKIFAVDVGTNQLDESLRVNPKVVVMENTDIRNVELLPETPDIALIDVSFISLDSILPIASNLIKDDGIILALLKPQFEVGYGNTNDGIVSDVLKHKEVLDKIVRSGEKIGLKFIEVIDSPILGKTGNKEYLLYFKK